MIMFYYFNAAEESKKRIINMDTEIDDYLYKL